jgi:hypothetical protein
MPSGMRPVADILYWYYSIDLQLQSLVCSRPFLCVSPSSALRGSGVNRSTGSKQTLNGLFICSPLVQCTRSKFTQFFAPLFLIIRLPNPKTQILTLFTISRGNGPDPALFYPGMNRKFIDGRKKNLNHFCTLSKDTAPVRRNLSRQ